MTESVLSKILSVRTTGEVSLEIRFEGGGEALMRDWLGSDLHYEPQGSGDLGDRMRRAIEDAFKDSIDSVVLIGSDVPGITGALVEKAFFRLNHGDLVLGPASDGGYYLIGLHKGVPSLSLPALFKGIEWGTGRVLSRTIDRAEGSNLNYLLLEQLSDVDRPEDLPVWEQVSLAPEQETGPDSISVIIPAVNEADNIEGAMKSAGSAEVREILVVDGGSTDGTDTLAKTLGACVVRCVPPRANQLNRGAVEATGDILLFLHADTRLPEKYASLILKTLKAPSVSAGAFRLGIDSPHPGLRLIEFLANFRSRYLHLPYGDQALFFRSRTFFRAGGFPQIPIMDDFELMRRLKKRGEIITLPERIRTSSRRWGRMGVLKTTWVNQLVIVAYLIGISPDVIARWYRRGRGV